MLSDDVLPAVVRLAMGFGEYRLHWVSPARDRRLVVRYQPNNYMALYHAGIAEFNMGDTRLAKEHLERFLELYEPNDMWRKNGLRVLAKIEKQDRTPVFSGHGEIR